MSKCYAVAGPSGSGTGPLTAAGVGATAAIRPMVNEFDCGCTTTPADVILTVRLASTNTSLGTSTSQTPSPLDPGDVASVSVGGITYTAEPTLNKEIIKIGLNARATYRWVAQDGREVTIAAGAATGAALTMVLAGSASVLTGNIIFRE